VPPQGAGAEVRPEYGERRRGPRTARAGAAGGASLDAPHEGLDSRKALAVPIPAHSGDRRRLRSLPPVGVSYSQELLLNPSEPAFSETARFV